MQNSFCSGTAVTRVSDNCFVVFSSQTCAIRVRLVSSLTSTECSTLCHPNYALPQQVDSIPSHAHTRYTSTSHFLFIHHYFFHPHFNAINTRNKLHQISSGWGLNFQHHNLEITSGPNDLPSVGWGFRFISFGAYDHAYFPSKISPENQNRELCILAKISHSEPMANGLLVFHAKLYQRNCQKTYAKNVCQNIGTPI